MANGDEEVARGKRRVHQHEMEEASIRLLAESLPPTWVLHDYAPDYGIDKVIEVFEPTANDQRVSETLGQHLMVQIKAVDSCEPTHVTVRERGNVAKPPTLFKAGGEALEIDVLRFVIDTDTLATVARMGSAVPVMLIVVCLDGRHAYFVCL